MQPVTDNTRQVRAIKRRHAVRALLIDTLDFAGFYESEMEMEMDVDEILGVLYIREMIATRDEPF